MRRSLHRLTKRLEVRPYRASDFGSWATAQKFLGPPRNAWDKGPRKPEDMVRRNFLALVRDQAEKRKRDFFYNLGIFLRTGGLVGGVSLMDVTRGVFQNAYLGYYIFNTHWGHGYAKEATHAALDIGFRDLKLHRIEAGVEPRNLRSHVVARSLGMRREGLKKRALFLRGKWVDITVYAMTTEDFGVRFAGTAPTLRPLR